MLSTLLTIVLSLGQCIDLAQSRSVEAAVAAGELKSAYWQYHNHRASLLPEVSLRATLPTLNKRYNVYQLGDGSYSYVRGDYMGGSATLSVSQRLAPTGGTLTLQSSLDAMRGLGSHDAGSRSQFMSIPVAITYTQPLFGLNTIRWDKRIEPLRYREAQANYLTANEEVAMQCISKFFALVIANEQVNIARQNLQTAEKLYEVALAKREMGQMSKNDVLQMRLNLLTAQSALTSAGSDQQTHMFDLRTFLNLDDDIEPIIPDHIPDVVLLYDEVLRLALTNNAFTSTMRLRQLQADYAVASARAQMLGINLYAELGYTGTADRLNDSYRHLSTGAVVEVGISLPLVDWGKRRGYVRQAENSREIERNRERRMSEEFSQNIFVLTERFNNQRRQLEIAQQADTIAQARYHTNVETFKIGTLSTLELSDAQTAKDYARQNHITQLYQYWYLYYQIRSITLWDFEKGHALTNNKVGSIN